MAPLESLPTEVTWLIIAHLPLSDKRNLRLANKWLEQQTRRRFVEEHFRSGQMILESEDSTASAAALLQSRDVASKIRSLFLKHWNTPEAEDTALFNTVIAKLPKLQKLTMSGARHGGSRSLLPIAGLSSALAESGAAVTQLVLEKCTLKLVEVDALVSTLVPSLQHLILEEVCSEDKAWPAILRSLRSLDLQSLDISDIMQGDPTSTESKCFFDHTHSIAKRFYEYPVESGDEQQGQKYKFSAVWTLMYGKQAAKAGLEALLGFWGEGN